jgi:hypothetical protein
MLCPKCPEEWLMESMGYGDEMCPECGHVEYAESDEDFHARIKRNNEPAARQN